MIMISKNAIGIYEGGGGRIAAGGVLFAGGPFAAGLIAGGLFASGLNAAPRFLLYQRIFNTFRSLPYPRSTMSYSILFSYFHILFSYSKLYSKLLFVPTDTTWVE